MKTANVRTVRHDLTAVLKYVRNGETIAITNRKETVALLTPPPSKSPKNLKPWQALRERLAQLEAQPMLATTGAELLSEDRDRY